MVAYVSTRGGAGRRSFEEVLLAGLAEDGGLFVPEAWPVLDLGALEGLGYAETAARVLAPFAEGCFSLDELEAMAAEAYAGFEHPAVAPLRQLDHDSWLMELFHGPTLAFKDFALQMLGRMFEAVLARRDEGITIVGATSGDTGSAAIHATAGRAGMRICVLHPEGRVSEVQRRQMTTVMDANVANIAIRGTFDDCQDMVKAMFNDAAFRSEMRLAAVNSINWARLAAQAAYYVHAGVRLQGPLTFSVPSGNFGDAYSGIIAHRLGLPIVRMIVATNRNDILARFLASGRYEAGEVHPTMSPSMDIQVASNFERLLFDMLGRDGAAVAATMREFQATRRLEVGGNGLAEARGLLVGHRLDEAGTAQVMRETLAASGYLADPHTAVGLGAARDVALPGERLVTLATAHPAKFPDAVEASTGVRPALPPALADLLQRPERYVVLDNDPGAVQAHIRSWAA